MRERNYLFSELSGKEQRIAIGEVQDYFFERTFKTPQDVVDFMDETKTECLFSKSGMIVCVGARITSADDICDLIEEEPESIEMIIDCDNPRNAFQVYKHIETERYFLIADNGNVFMELEPVASLTYSPEVELKEEGNMYRLFDCVCCGECFSDTDDADYMWFKELKRQ